MAKQFTYITLDEEPETVVLNKKDVLEKLKHLGVRKGMVLLVQANTKKIGHLIGGEQMLIEALMESVGYEGTIVIPTFTKELLDPACQESKIARTYWNDVRDYALAFDKKLTVPSNGDLFIDQFLRNEGVVRSYHPLYSFAAWGKYAKVICNEHPLHFGLNEDSPLGKIVNFNGFVVTLGCEYSDCAVFQLARYKVGNFPVRIVSAPIKSNNCVQWKNMLDLDYEKKEIDEIGKNMEEKCVVKSCFIGSAKSRFFSSREATSSAITFFRIHNDEIRMSTK